MWIFEIERNRELYDLVKYRTWFRDEKCYTACQFRKSDQCILFGKYIYKENEWSRCKECVKMFGDKPDVDT